MSACFCPSSFCGQSNLLSCKAYLPVLLWPYLPSMQLGMWWAAQTLPQSLRHMAGPRWNNCFGTSSISCAEDRSSPASSSGVRAIPPSHPQMSPLLIGAHLTGSHLVLRLCQGDISVYFRGEACEARAETKEVLIKKRSLQLGPIPLHLSHRIIES